MTQRDLVGAAEDWGEADRIDVIERLVDPGGLRLYDVGCGDGALARQLAERGAQVVGIEPDPGLAARNRAAAPVPGVAFVEAPGEALPLDDASADGVIFSYSLHHVPAACMDRALDEAMRVLRPARGFLCVLEPLLTGSMAEVWQHIHDETVERTQAYEALGRTVAGRFAEAREIRYRQPVFYDDRADFLAEVRNIPWVGWDEKWADPRVRRATEAAFERGRTDRGYRFDDNVRVNFYRHLL